MSPRRLCTFEANDSGNCAHQDEHINENRPVADIVEIIFELNESIAFCATIAIVNLRPACDSGCDCQPRAVKGNSSLQPLHKVRAFRARSNHTHLSAKDIDQLRKLI